MKVLIAGWFSIADGHATIGDWLSLQSICNALATECIPFDVLSPGKGHGNEYPVKVWVCGPVDRSYPPQQALIGDGAGWILLSATLITDRLDVGAADVSAARDGPAINTRADLAFLSAPFANGAFAAVLLRGHQPEYRTTEAHHFTIREAVNDAVLRAGMFPVYLSTSVAGVASPDVLGAGLERVISSAAVTITSRLHGIFHSLRAGVVPVVVNEVPEGGKVSAFAREFGLPILLSSEICTTERLMSAIDDIRHVDQSVAASVLKRAKESARNNLNHAVSLITTRLASEL